MLNLVFQAAMPSSDGSGRLPEQSILLVDDNEDLRGSTADLLRTHGFLVKEAADAITARRVWQAVGGTNALITDLRMPGEDGLELAESLRREQDDLPVLLISSHIEPGMAGQLARRNMAYRSKPFSILTLVAGLEEARVRAGSPRAVKQPPNEQEGPGPRTGKGIARAWMSKAAALLVVALGLGWLFASAGPPALPDLDTSATRRSFRVEPLEPRGEQQVAPESMRWREVEGVERYQVTLLRPGDKVVWRGEAERSPLVLPATLEMKPAIRYTWRVDALGRDGERIAWSEAASFWLEPSGDEVKED